MSKKNRKDDDLDTETTFVDMNVDGFRWYDPTRKKDGKPQKQPKVSRKEYWKMVRAAFAAYLPYFVILICAFGIMVAIAYLWLK